MTSSMRRRLLMLALTPALATPIAAQGRGRWSRDVPRGHLPPAGLCRVWIRGVPPGRQPRPMDCRTAVRRAPRNAQVLYGGTYARGPRGAWAYHRDGRHDGWQGEDRGDHRWRRGDDEHDRGRRSGRERWDRDRRDGSWYSYGYGYGDRDDAWIAARRRPGPCLVRDQWGACALRVAIVVRLP